MIMSYIKPELVEPNIKKLIINKLELKKNKVIIDNEVKEQIRIQNEILNIPPKPFYYKILYYFLDFLKNNYIIIIILTLLSILLYIRHIETLKRKKKIKEILEQTNY